MLIWNILVSLFTNFKSLGMPHTVIIIALFIIMAILQFFLLYKAKKIVRFLPIIITIGITLITQLVVWVFAYLIHSYFFIIIVFGLLYFEVANLGALLGLVVYPMFCVFLKDKVRK